MAKVAFSKLKCKIDDTEVAIKIGEEIVMVKQYLPIQDKLLLIGNVVSQSHDPEVNYENPVLASILAELYICFAYTNISFTDKQKEDLPKLYDQLKSSGVLDEIKKAIPEAEFDFVLNSIRITSKSIYDYRQSVLGILEIAKEEYNATDMDLSKITETLRSDDIAMLKDIVSKMG